ncbi:2Fe-2S iron-sulfur cluster-binding protein [Bradyrhizobium sp. dw_411]|uniref:xanthine dehydrogenase family Fe-S subunit n=1 Tax=Bradyrhizobium sp. dw_411 TaxID=2720082 RepID=UPI001BCDB46A|nr:2Fe-2S iron-sulfur cluster-binding protein [Bradyrhizobium sp. dw_411]
MMQINLTINGQGVEELVEPRTHLADFLRDRLHLTATHIRCEQGVCGACTILIDGSPARSCITYAALCQGAEVVTLEGLENDEIIESLRTAFSIEHGLQCGFCTPGMLVTARDIIRRLPDADEARVRRELNGNLCRCTGYAGIARAICRVLEARRAAAAKPETSTAFKLGPVGARHLPGASTTEKKRLPQSAPKPEVSCVDPKDLGKDLGLGSRAANLETSLSFTVAHGADETWAALADVENVARCMPGASLTEHSADGRLAGRVTVKIGPIATNFIGTGLIVRDEEARRGILYGSGRDRLSGTTVRAEVSYAVTGESDTQSRVDVTVRALLAGALAQFSRSSIVQDLVGRITAEFSRRLQQSLTDPQSVDTSETSLKATTLVFDVVMARLKSLRDRLFGRKQADTNNDRNAS